MIGDELFSKSGGEFPYRRYINGTSDNISRLRYLIEDYVPEYNWNGFDQKKIEGKVKSRMKDGVTIFDFFEPGPKLIAKETDWNYNSVIDWYTETARMSSPGYGKDYSPNDLWFKTSFSKIRDKILNNKKTLEQAREAIFDAGEVRLAYVTDCIGLYNYVKTLLNQKSNPRVIDITAFGDRLVASASVGFDYIGLDPDPNLVDGISRLLLDVKTINPDFNAITYTIPLEHFTVEKLVDFVSFSPPPYNAEPYSGGERQTHKVYTDFRRWFYGFIREALTRAFFWLREGGILGFTVLDRDGPTKIYYTEAMILLAMSLGFKPLKIYSLSSSSGTPWWLFQKDSSFKDSPEAELFMEHYRELMIPEFGRTIHPANEYLRLLASKYVTEIVINANLLVKSDKAADTLGRIMMSKVPDKEDPDPLFPDESSEIILNESDFNSSSQIIYPIVIQTPDPGYRMIITREGRDVDSARSASDTLLQIFNSVISYLHWVQCTNEFENFRRAVKVSRFEQRNGRPIVNLYIDRRDEFSAISFLRKRGLFVKSSLDNIKVFPKFVVLWSSSDNGISISNISSYIRYDAVGLVGHHFTRPESRIRAIATIANVKSSDEIVDLFATPSNANSRLYASVYPDVDPQSLGNFFSYDGGDYKVLMANPPPYDGFNEKMIDRLMNVYLPGKTIFYSTTMWEDDGKIYLDRIKNGEDPLFNDLEHYYVLTSIWQKYKEYVKAVYILDYNSHPTLDNAKGMTYTKKTRPTESIGVILSDSDHKLNLDKLDLLSKGAHVLFE